MFSWSKVACVCALVCVSGCLPAGEGSGDDNNGPGEGGAPVVVVSRDGDPIAANASITIAQGTRVAFDASGSSDPDGDTLSFAWALSGPDGASIVEGDDATFDYTFDAVGSYVIELEVSDGELEATGRVTVDVELVAQNRAPIADAGSDASGTSGDTLTLDGSGSSDPDGDALTFAWLIADAPAGSTAALSDAGAPSPTLTPDLVGAYTVTLTVDDGNGGVDSDAVSYTHLTLPTIYSV